MFRAAFGAVSQILGFRRLRHHTVFMPTLRKGSRVLDLGAHKGEFSAQLLEFFPDLRIVMVEANPYLASNLSSLNDSRINFVHGAVVASAVERICRFNVSSNPEASSVNRDMPGVFGIREVCEVPAITFTELLRDASGGLALVKMDIEGAELDVLAHADESLVDHVDQLTIEFHDEFVSSTSATVKRTLDALATRGFFVLNASQPFHDDVVLISRKWIVSQTLFRRWAIIATLQVAKALYATKGFVHPRRTIKPTDAGAT